jgi:hypothetical protein
MDIKHYSLLDLMSNSLVDRHKHFRETCSLHLHVSRTSQKARTLISSCKFVFSYSKVQITVQINHHHYYSTGSLVYPAHIIGHFLPATFVCGTWLTYHVIDCSGHYVGRSPYLQSVFVKSLSLQQEKKNHCTTMCVWTMLYQSCVIINSE